ncbi:small conductance mechanosensitive ion channel protein [Enterococcus phoeniculicola]|jgi:small-conductance mechanosensitive channel|uniref:Small conductance mechanosensitive ion channel protein n=1 Tax=Enterococcus phoeniculicola ATCC BAA-412 TaxID=1158610 RepID=R3WWH2_9ENTE|nr:mechanosensitive ion channel family protein [Enterococcus phoeniculicola]EOL46130.1 small conductance mechanosensitive ion channel protein [Enterococcus phoeniculicola ATCC BAA-412]EOT77025.1 small conductance mechanosensitive ion channel protein [Enterococcus phoeniculicola ATCC BAA-412]OJG73364.1 small conductance mechanosensitive ion channel protein [Enterococcus phoeniculicola]
MFFKLFLTQATTESTTETIVEQTTKKLNAFQRFWEGIDWDQVVALLIEKTIYLILTIVLFGILNRLGKYFINKLYDRYQKKAHLSENRIDTLHTLLNNVYAYMLVFFFIYSVLSIIGVPVGSLLAGAGIAGLAIGLGAQGFMNDIITGFFIIMEQQIDVGDYIRLVNLTIEGKVVSVGIRTIQLQSIDGTIHFIPNRNITTISNLSRANMQVVVDVRILPDEGYEKIREVIEAVNHRLAKEHEDEIQTGPTLFGMVDLGNANFAVRTNMYVLNGQQAQIKEEFLTTYVKELSEAGFTIPNTPIVTP